MVRRERSANIESDHGARVSASHPIARRRFLLLLGAVVGAGIGMRLPFWPGPAESGERRLAGLFAHFESAQAVGRQYLRTVPAEADSGILLELVARGLPNQYHTLRATGDDELRALLAIRVSEDFKEDRTVEVSGWVLARTEARICALTALV